MVTVMKSINIINVINVMNVINMINMIGIMYVMNITNDKTLRADESVFRASIYESGTVNGNVMMDMMDIIK